MSSIADAIQDKCLAFSDRIIKLNDYLLAQAVAAHEEYKNSKLQKKGKTSSFFHQPSDISVAAVPVYLQSVSNLCNQLLRSGTSIGVTMLKHVTPLAKQISSPKVLLLLKKHGNLYIGLTCFIAIATWTINNTKAYTMMLKN